MQTMQRVARMKKKQGREDSKIHFSRPQIDLF